MSFEVAIIPFFREGISFKKEICTGSSTEGSRVTQEIFCFIMCISGVGGVDTAVANHLINITKVTRLMGCSCTISGVSPAIAQTIVELGIEVGTVKTTGTMKDALSDAYRRLGLEINLVS